MGQGRVSGIWTFKLTDDPLGAGEGDVGGDSSIFSTGGAAALEEEATGASSSCQPPTLSPPKTRLAKGLSMLEGNTLSSGELNAVDCAEKDGGIALGLDEGIGGDTRRPTSVAISLTENTSSVSRSDRGELSCSAVSSPGVF